MRAVFGRKSSWFGSLGYSILTHCWNIVQRCHLKHEEQLRSFHVRGWNICSNNWNHPVSHVCNSMYYIDLYCTHVFHMCVIKPTKCLVVWNYHESPNPAAHHWKRDPFGVGYQRQPDTARDLRDRRGSWSGQATRGKSQGSRKLTSHMC